MTLADLPGVRPTSPVSGFSGMRHSSETTTTRLERLSAAVRAPQRLTYILSSAPVCWS